MKILLTGVTSFVGRHIAAHLVSRGISVVGTYRTDGPALRTLQAIEGRELLKLVQIDLADQDRFRELPSALDAIVHIAGVSAAPGIGPEEIIACNVAGAANTLGYGLQSGARKLIYASTLSVHGRISTATVDTTTPILEPDTYGSSKYLAERIFAASVDKLPAAAIRLPGVIGPGAHRAWMPTMMHRIHAGEPITIFNPDGAFNNAAHVDDLACLTASMLEDDWDGFHAFPVAAAGMTTVRLVAERLMLAAGKSVSVNVVPARGHSFTVSSDYAMRRFGYRPAEIGEMIDRYATDFVGHANSK